MNTRDRQKGRRQNARWISRFAVLSLCPGNGFRTKWPLTFGIVIHFDHIRDNFSTMKAVGQSWREITAWKHCCSNGGWPWQVWAHDSNATWCPTLAAGASTNTVQDCISHVQLCPRRRKSAFPARLHSDGESQRSCRSPLCRTRWPGRVCWRQPRKSANAASTSRLRSSPWTSALALRVQRTMSVRPKNPPFQHAYSLWEPGV